MTKLIICGKVAGRGREFYAAFRSIACRVSTRDGSYFWGWVRESSRRSPSGSDVRKRSFRG